MNGRIYDPALGRFMTADPIIPGVANLQSYNRYAYAINNPLAYTDPSGYFSIGDVFKVAVVVAVAVYAPQFLAANFAWAGAVVGPTMEAAASIYLTTTGAIASGAIGGFAIAYAATNGSFEAGVHGALSGAMFGLVGAYGTAADWGTTGFTAAHAAVGCATGAMLGGKCGPGALSAAAAKFATLQGPDLGNPVANGIKAVTIGGTASVLGGGKFTNGAVTAAYGYLFNQAAHAQAEQARNGLYTVPGNYRSALGMTFGVDGQVIDGIIITENSDFARLHGSNTLATTRENAIYLRDSGASFIANHDLVLHEYYHVIRQWNTGALSVPGYVIESFRSGYWNNKFEVEARQFARDNVEQFKRNLERR